MTICKYLAAANNGHGWNADERAGLRRARAFLITVLDHAQVGQFLRLAAVDLSLGVREMLELMAEFRRRREQDRGFRTLGR
jgi:hypothetical protein